MPLLNAWLTLALAVSGPCVAGIPRAATSPRFPRLRQPLHLAVASATPLLDPATVAGCRAPRSPLHLAVASPAPLLDLATVACLAAGSSDDEMAGRDRQCLSGVYPGGGRRTPVEARP
ncbi:unnamed protein product [Urochloa humidicola]